MTSFLVEPIPYDEDIWDECEGKDFFVVEIYADS